MKEIMDMPYIQFIIGMLDVVQIDYEAKSGKENDRVNKPKTAEEEVAAITGFL